jgi:hypothetical protein
LHINAKVWRRLSGADEYSVWQNYVFSAWSAN